MHIGFVPYLDIEGGGVRQYSLTIGHALQAFAEAHPEHTVTILHAPGLEDKAAAVAGGYTCHPLTPVPAEAPWRRAVGSWAAPAIERLGAIVGEGPHRDLWRRLRRTLRPRRRPPSVEVWRADHPRARPDVSAWLHSHRIDLMIYPVADPLAFETDLPYLVAIHDLQHRLQPHFAEVSIEGEWAWREYLYRNGSRYAAGILADSPTGREDILRHYGQHGVMPDRVYSLPYLPVHYLTAKESADRRSVSLSRYTLPERFLFYPSHFWPSKNHLGLVLALGKLRETAGLEIPLVVCGSRNGALRDQTFRAMMSAAECLGIASQITYLGYVPDEVMASLFTAATVLTMPTFFGPTNLPVIEAWQMRCPVLSSSVHGIREQVGDAGLLVDPSSTDEIAAGIQRLWTDPDLRAALVRAGTARIAAYTEADFNARFASILGQTIERIGTSRPK